MDLLRLIVTTELDGSVRIWDAQSGALLNQLSGHTGSVRYAAWNEDSSRIVTASSDGTARMWDVQSGVEIARLIGHQAAVTHAEWNPSGTRILTASDDGTARIYYVSIDDLLQVACQQSVRNMTEQEWKQYMGAQAYRATCSTPQQVKELPGPTPLPPEKPTLSPTMTPAVTSTPSSKDVQTSSGKIVFVSLQDGNREIYTTNSDGSNLDRLTQTPIDEFQPTWSPNGDQIAFQRGSGAKGEIWIMDVKSRQARILTNGRCPAWSPDGQQIVFVSFQDGNPEIYTIGVNGANMKRLTDHPKGDWFPDWSPDGRRIAFSTFRNGDAQICLMEVDGDKVECLADGDIPVWSPDGRRILFSSRGFCTMDAKGLNTQCSGIYGFHANWSPDGRHILFTDSDGDVGKIYSIGVDGGEKKLVADNAAYDSRPDWKE